MAQEYKGKPVFKGIALGPVTVLKKQDVQVKREKAGERTIFIMAFLFCLLHMLLFVQKLSNNKYIISSISIH